MVNVALYFDIAAFVQICTIPLDTAKVRLQLQKRAALGDDVGASKYKGLLGTVATIAKEEGLLALWKGIIPGLHRQFIYGGLRISLYEPVSIKYPMWIFRLSGDSLIPAYRLHL